MKHIFKTLKKYTLPILMVLVLLVIQAMCDLALPDYTSKIVNVGIQQGGIENAVPEVMTEENYNKFMLFVDEDKKNVVKDNYKLITHDDKTSQEYKDNVSKYPSLKDENLYILKDNLEEDTIDNLNDALSLPIMLVSSMSSDEFNLEDMAETEEQKQMLQNLPQDVDVFTILSNIDKTKLNEIITKIKTQFKDMEPSLVEQSSIEYIKNEYKAIGVDVEHIQTNYIFISGLKMLGLALIAMAITVVSTFIASRIAANFSRDLRSKVVNKVMTYSNTEFEKFQTSSLITRSTNDIQQIQMLIIMLLRIVFYAPIIGIGALTKVMGNSMAWVIGIAVLVILSIAIILFSIALPKFQLVQKLIDKLNLVSREILTGLPVIRAFATESYEEERFDKANKDLTKANLFVNRVMTVMMPTMMFVMNGVSILIVWVGAGKIDAGTMQVGNLLAFITYTMQIIMAFLMISMVSIMVPRAFISMKRIGEVLNTDSSIKEVEESKPFDPDKKGEVEFKDVYFRYPDAEEDVLQNISFKATKGTTTAFIGSTGSGKSTLINLIPRFFDVTGGKILIDGVNIKDIKLHDLREKIGFVPQKGILFSGTIKSNIGFGTKHLSKEQLEKAARISQSLEFIEEKKNTYDTPISQGGTNVSGGQRQRLAIARAIAIEPEFYVFDDSFSALDYKTDAKLRKALAKETKNSTIFIVAQRISTVMNADQIIVLDKGSIVGIGKHKNLMKTCDIYREIALSQLSKEELADE